MVRNLSSSRSQQPKGTNSFVWRKSSTSTRRRLQYSIRVTKQRLSTFWSMASCGHFHTSPDGERQIVAFHWPGDLFGLAEHGRHVTSAETITSSQIYRFPCQKLERFLLKNPKIEDGFLIKAIHDLRSAQRQLIIMGRLAIFRRLAVFLLDCSAHEHYFDKAKRLLTLPMSRYDIADYLGTSAETVTRALSKLTADDAVRRVSAPRAKARFGEAENSRRFRLKKARPLHLPRAEVDVHPPRRVGLAASRLRFSLWRLASSI